jgi:hypothetical protein
MFSGMINSADLPVVLNLMTQHSTTERKEALMWLTEKTDRAEQIETWNLTMEVAITVLVLFSLIVEFLALLRRGS